MLKYNAATYIPTSYVQVVCLPLAKLGKNRTWLPGQILGLDWKEECIPMNHKIHVLSVLYCQCYPSLSPALADRENKIIDTYFVHNVCL